MVRHYFMEEVVEVPDDVNASVKEDEMIISGPKGTLNRRFFHPSIRLNAGKEGIRVFVKKPCRKDLALFGTWLGHLRNMIKGVTEGFEYRMKIVYSHFPMKTTVKKDGFYIENFLGGSFPRKAKIMGNTKVQISGDEVILTGINKEDTGQTAANIELATHIKRYDPRVFQDGIYIVSKGR